MESPHWIMTTRIGRRGTGRGNIITGTHAQAGGVRHDVPHCTVTVAVTYEHEDRRAVESGIYCGGLFLITFDTWLIVL